MPSPDDLKQIAPTGTLRGGVVTAPAASAFFAINDDTGAIRGITVNLLRNLADALKLPFEMQIFDNSGQVTDAVAGGTCDVAFMPHDAERAKKVDFGPSYYIIESTYLVPAGSALQTFDDVNKPGVRIVAIANTTTMRSARRTAPQSSVEEVSGVEQMVAMAAKGDGDVFALTHDSLARLLPKLPGARVLPGNFQQVGIGIAVPPGRPAALGLVSEWLGTAKADGTVRRAFDAAGFRDLSVAS